ncbi:helix-turn-helix domain-containing protein [Streptomyces asiaticus]
MGLTADRLQAAYTADVDIGGKLTYVARPVLDQLETRLTGVPATIFLTDERARLLQRRAGEPPLRRHIEDMAELVPFLLAKLTSPTSLTCSPAVMRLLMRATWPGNVAQLRKILSAVVQHRRSGVMEASDLPPECQTVSRRVLSPLDSLERDAIVRSLIDAKGNRSRAARALGVSRATIYRKIHDYGIDLPQ